MIALIDQIPDFNIVKYDPVLALLATNVIRFVFIFTSGVLQLGVHTTLPMVFLQIKAVPPVLRGHELILMDAVVVPALTSSVYAGAVVPIPTPFWLIRILSKLRLFESKSPPLSLRVQKLIALPSPTGPTATPRI
jgi:hypothetical protein